MLAQYEISTQALLQSPSAPIPLISNATLDSYINTARLQVAGQGACIRVYGSLALVPGQRQYNFSSVTGFPAGVNSIFRIRQIWFTIPGTAGQIWLASRPFEYFSIFALNNPTPPSGQPQEWSQFGQGDTGNIFVDPLPDLPYVCPVDAVGVANGLATDADLEAIPPLWTLAVPFYAAWLAFQSVQRQSDADLMLKRFEEQMALARNAANPELLTENWSQMTDKMEPNRLGITATRAG